MKPTHPMKPIYPMKGPVFEDPPEKSAPRVKIYLDEDVMKGLCEYAERMDVSPAQLMREILSKHISTKKKS